MWLPILFAVAVLPFGISFYFFLIGIGDGTVGAPNIALWLAILTLTGGLWLGALHLARRGERTLAALMLLVLAAPTVPAALFFGFLAATVTSWH